MDHRHGVVWFNVCISQDHDKNDESLEVHGVVGAMDAIPADRPKAFGR